jgi:hypothetical protein
MKRILIFAALVALLATDFGHGQSFEWVEHLEGNRNDNADAIATDRLGAVYVAGSFRNTITIGGFTLTSRGGMDIYLAKFAANGDPLWVKSAGGSSDDQAFGLAVDSANNVGVVGSFRNTAVFSSYTIPSSGMRDAFVAKYTSDGVVKWVVKAGSNYDDVAHDVAIDSAGGYYVVGYSHSGTDKDLLLAKYNSFGELQFGGTYASAGGHDDVGYAIATNNEDAFYATGTFNGTLSFTGGDIVGTGGFRDDVFLAEFGAYAGELRDRAIFDNDGNVAPNALVYTNDALYLGGEFDSKVYTPGLDSLVSVGGYDMFLAEFDASDIGAGERWLRQNGGSSDDKLHALAPDDEGGVVFGGSYGDSCEFNVAAPEFMLFSDDATEAVAGVYSAAGKVAWAQIGTGFGDAAAMAVGYDGDERVYLAGVFGQNISFGATEIVNVNTFYPDAFLVRMSEGANILSLDAPEFGDRVLGDAPYKIKWTASEDVAAVRLEYDANGDGDWTDAVEIVPSYPAAAGEFSYRFPNAPGSSYRVRALDANNSSINDASLAFTVCDLSLDAPAATQTWDVGSLQTIAWSSTGIPALDLDYSTNGKNGPWTPIASHTVAATHDWTIPATPTNNAYLRLRDADETNENVVVYSPLLKFVPTLVVSQPENGDLLTASTKAKIEWTHEGARKIKIEFSVDSGATYAPITGADSVDASLGAYEWLVPDMATTRGIIRISDVDYPDAVAVSSGAFTIQIPPKGITVLSPNGGEALKAGHLYPISWESYYVDYVKIVYSVDDGITDETVAEYVACEGGVNQHQWLVPNTPTVKGKVKVTDAIDPLNHSDVSDAGFVIEYDASDPGWLPPATDRSHAIVAPMTLTPEVDGTPLDVGDYFGAFYEVSGELRCGGYGRWSGAKDTTILIYGDDFNTAAVDGFTEGERIQWKFLRLSDGKELSAWATYDSSFTADSLYETNGISKLTALDGTEFLLHTMELDQAWNTISTYVNPIDTPYAAMTPLTVGEAVARSGLEDRVIIVKNSDGKVYYPSLGIDDIGAWKKEDGYQVKVKIDSVRNFLTVSGAPVDPVAAPISIDEGWSLVGYLLDRSTTTTETLADIAADLTLAMNGDGDLYMPGVANSMPAMSPGEGYWIKAKRPTTLFYPSDDATPAPTSAPTSAPLAMTTNETYYDAVAPTNHNATVVFPLSAVPAGIAAGDEIAAFSEDGLLVGSKPYDGQAFALTVWGDDEFTDEIDGLRPGESFSLRAHLEGEGAERSIASLTFLEGADVYYHNAIIVVESFALGSVVGTGDREKSLPRDFFVDQNYPNPFNPSTTVRFGLPVAGETTVAVFNHLGERVATLLRGELSAGTHSATWRPTNVASGVYFIRVESGDYSRTIKAAFVK